VIRVKATREGLPGGKTATGYRVDPHVPFVALPSTAATRLWVKIHNPANNKIVKALCLDIGPWSEIDHAYVFQPATMDHIGLTVPPDTIRPRAESGTDERGRKTNGAGIDLGERVWRDLGLPPGGGSAEVGWEFL
jgi:hypothetical protein